MLSKRLIELALFATLAAVPARGQWTRLNVPVWYDACLARTDSTLFVGSDSGIFMTTNRGKTWEKRSGALNYGIMCMAARDSILILGTRGGVDVSQDRGKSWRYGYGDTYVYALLFRDSNLFAAIGGGIYRSSNNGSTWVEADSLPPGNGKVGGAISLAHNGSNLYAAGETEVFSSTDNGTSWLKRGREGLPPYVNCSLVAIGPYLILGGQGGTFRSSDGGITWTSAMNGMNTGALALDVHDSILVEATGDAGVFLSRDSGANWSYEGLSGDVPSILLTDSDIFVACFSSILFHPLFEMIGQNAVAEKPLMKQALRTYPNPFSQSTTISFTPESSGYAEVSIVNLLGVEVARIFSGEIAAGEHTFTWDAATGGSAAADATGMYECLVRMNGRIEKLPIMLMR